MRPIPIRFGVGITIVLCIAVNACAPTRLAIHAAKEAVRFTEQKKPEQEGTQSTPTSPSQGGRYKVGEPYEIDRIWYYPKEDPDYSETGIASWYGNPFHGRKTANGETYNMNALTAAHKTLPMPSYVRVTNLENGRALTVRINDRGPFVHRRIIDLSRRGAQLLGFEKDGTARVRVEAVPSQDELEIVAKPETPDSARFAVPAAPVIAVEASELPPPKGITQAPRQDPSKRPVGGSTVQKLKTTQLYVQVGAFSFVENAERLRNRLTKLMEVSVAPTTVNGQELFRVRIGPIANLAKADETLEQLIDNGHIDARIVVE